MRKPGEIVREGVDEIIIEKLNSVGVYEINDGKQVDGLPFYDW